MPSPPPSLAAALAALDAALDAHPPIDARARAALADARARIEQALTEAPDDRVLDDVPGPAAEALARLEVEHPEVAEALRRLGAAVGGAGI
jgi:aminoglycoside phosphotransferase